MNESSPTNTFRGLPLTPEQQREVDHYIHRHQRAGQAWNTPELQAMLRDMLDPPEVSDYSPTDAGDATSAERETADHEDPPEPERD